MLKLSTKKHFYRTKTICQHVQTNMCSDPPRVCCFTFQRFPCATLPHISKTKGPMRSIQQATLRKFSQSFQTSIMKLIIKILKKWQMGSWCVQPLKVFTPPAGGFILLMCNVLGELFVLKFLSSTLLGIVT